MRDAMARLKVTADERMRPSPGGAIANLPDKEYSARESHLPGSLPNGSARSFSEHALKALIFGLCSLLGLTIVCRHCQLSSEDSDWYVLPIGDHLVCKQCNRVIDVVSKRLDDLSLPPSQRQGFEIEDYSVHFTGICAECVKQRSE